MRYWRAVNASVAPVATRKAAQLALTLASQDLGIDEPKLRWIAPASGPGEQVIHKSEGIILGFCRAGRITNNAWWWHVFLRTDLDTAAAMETVFHESRHLWQVLHGGASWGNARREADADLYMERMTQIWNPPARWKGAATGIAYQSRTMELSYA